MPKEDSQVEHSLLPVLVKESDGKFSQLRHWNSLPNDVKRLIFQKLPLLSVEGLCFRTVSRSWKNNIDLAIAQIPSQTILELISELPWDNARLLLDFINVILVKDPRWKSDNLWDIALNTYRIEDINQINRPKLNQAIKQLEEEIAKLGLLGDCEKSHPKSVKLRKVLEKVIYSLKKTLSVLENSYNQPFEVLPDDRKSYCDNYINLRGANFCRAHLRVVNFTGANLESANFSFANLEGALFVDVYLVNANFSNANLNGAICVQANLKNANFKNATLTRADFRAANLEGTALSNMGFNKLGT